MRGNPTMRAKRVTGPSAQTTMLTHFKLERCSKCGKPAMDTQGMITRNDSLDSKVRTCIDCIGVRKVNGAQEVTRLLKLPWE